MIDEEMHFISLDKIVKDAQSLFRQYVPKGKNMVDDFLENKRIEAKLEEEKYNSLGKK